MEPPDPSFADEFNVSREDAVLVFDYAELRSRFPSRFIVLRFL